MKKGLWLLICCHMTTDITTLNIEQIHISPLKPVGPIPMPSAVDIDKARLYGIGVLPSIKVRAAGHGEYELIQGLAAWRAAQYLRIDSVDVQVLEIDDVMARDMVADDFAPSLKRRNPIHEGQTIKQLAIAESTTPTRIGAKLGISRYEVSNYIRILKLDKEVQCFIESGELDLGKAKMLLTLTHTQQLELAKRIIKERWTTRKVEDEIRAIKGDSVAQPLTGGEQSRNNSNSHTTESKQKDPAIKLEEDELTEALGSAVCIDHDNSTGEGRIIITYSNLDVYSGIAERLRGGYRDR